jgi:hypothetical protein
LKGATDTAQGKEGINSLPFSEILMYAVGGGVILFVLFKLVTKKKPQEQKAPPAGQNKYDSYGNPLGKSSSSSFDNNSHIQQSPTSTINRLKGTASNKSNEVN